MTQTILVTGGLGVNGVWVVRRLVAEGFRPIVYDTGSDAHLDAELRKYILLVNGDISDVTNLTELLEKHRVETVIHMASLIVGLQEDPIKGYQVNVAGTVSLLRACATASVRRIVFTSSRAVYGDVEGQHGHPSYSPIDEDYRVAPVNMYDVCKVFCEGFGRNFCALNDIEFVVLRFSAILGPGKAASHGNFGVLSSIVECAFNGKPIEIPRGGDQVDDVIFVKDAAYGIFLAATRPVGMFSVFNISRNVGTTLHNLADAVRIHVPQAQITIGDGLDYLRLGVNYYGLMDNRRAREQLGFKPKYDLVSGVGNYLNHLKQRST